jgi:hypothetical protein
MKAIAITAVAVALMLAASFGVAYVSWYLRGRRLRKLALSRDTLISFSGFKAAFAEFSESRIREAHDFVQEQVGIAGFPIQVEDHLWDTLELDQGNVLSELESIFERHGLPVPADVSSGPEVATVRDLVTQFDACTSRARLQARHGT